MTKTSNMLDDRSEKGDHLLIKNKSFNTVLKLSTMTSIYDNVGELHGTTVRGPQYSNYTVLN